QAWLGAFLQALAQSGWIIGRNVRIDTRWAATNTADIRRHAAELAALALCGAVAQGGGAPAQEARRRRDRARRRGLRASLEWRPDRDRGRAGAAASRSDHHAGGPAQAARGLLRSRLRRRRRPPLLWA